MLFPNRALIIRVPNTPHGHLSVDKSKELCEFQGIPKLPKRLAQILDVPRAIDGLPVGIVAFIKHTRGQDQELNGIVTSKSNS